MSKKALIAGIFGQDGAYLAELLLSLGYDVYGGYRYSSTRNSGNLEILEILDKIKLVQIDVSNQFEVFSVIKDGKYDEVYNLAANSFVPNSFTNPESMVRTNANGPFYLLEAIRLFSPKTRFYQASTSEMFGNSKMPRDGFTLRSKMRPRSVYGSTKLFAHNLVTNYREAHGLFAVSGVLFNHESRLRGENFVTKKITKWVGRYSVNRGIEPLRLGNIYAIRDWGFAGDYVRAMQLMLQKPNPEDFVIATGEMNTVEGFLQMALKCINLDYMFDEERGAYIDLANNKEIVIIDQKLLRNAEVDMLKGNPSKAKHRLKWEPKVSLQEMVHSMVFHDRFFANIEKVKMI